MRVSWTFVFDADNRLGSIDTFVIYYARRVQDLEAAVASVLQAVRSPL